MILSRGELQPLRSLFPASRERDGAGLREGGATAVRERVRCLTLKRGPDYTFVCLKPLGHRARCRFISADDGAGILWITGAPGVGKTTLAHHLAKTRNRVVILDGDDVRQWLTPDCGFSSEDRLKHARRVWEVARRIAEAGGTAIVALVAHPPAPVDLLIWVDGPARRPLWPGTTYTPPEHPDLVVRT